MGVAAVRGHVGGFTRGTAAPFSVHAVDDGVGVGVLVLVPVPVPVLDAVGEFDAVLLADAVLLGLAVNDAWVLVADAVALLLGVWDGV